MATSRRPGYPRRMVKRLQVAEKKTIMVDSFMKLIVLIIVLHGLGCVTASYVLAFRGSMEALENLSSTVVTQIIAPVATYGITKTIENVSKYNDWLLKYAEKKYGISISQEESTVNSTDNNEILG